MSDLVARDREARREAIRPDRSFIVQAPAGSGKTSLLTQRFLRLLAGVERPEEIVAITFTRKAAAEMRHRLLGALAAGGQPLPDDAGEHERLSWELARAALDNGRRRGWDLDQQPSRLHIQTLDGLNHWLAARLPLSARLALSPVLLDDARPLYAEAAWRFGTRLEEDGPLAGHIARLARLLDHQPARLGPLVAEMLARRELWLPKLYELAAAGNMRAGMEQLLAAAGEARLAHICRQLDVDPFRDLVELLHDAAGRDPAGPLAPLAGWSGLPGCTPDQREAWECIARRLLTAGGAVRKRVDRNMGFPPELGELKSGMTRHLDWLAGSPGQVAALAAIGQLPPVRYTEVQWERAEALCEALVPAAAELQALFAERGMADHAAVGAAARLALGGRDGPSELALALDYRIRHLLVDEYQDTSAVQHDLLQRLVAGWQAGDGHSLFCVGDPMQSIYAFREADVTLFLDAQRAGIGSVVLNPVSLRRNFRSCRAIVDWINAAFAAVLPEVADYQSGAVPYTASAATREDEAGAGVRVHPLLGRDEQAAAARVADVVEQSLAEIARLEQPDGRGSDDVRRSVAVLVRARSALPPLLAELRRRGIDHRGVELEPLGERAAVRDVLALARALLHAGDRTAWLAVLRAPWSGLTLQDLHRLATGDPGELLPTRLQQPDCLARLSGEGRQRVERILPALLAALRDHGRSALGSWVRSCWLAIDGPATLEDPSDLDNVESCFIALDALAAESGPMPSAAAVEAAVDGLMASPTGSEEARVQLMTIHKAKGLEFDTVILPALERTAASNSRQLLYWTRVAVEGEARGIVLASRGERADRGSPDALESWMRRLESERTEFELGRLAYVAATRARRCLHLVGTASVGADERGSPVLQAPRKSSMLGLLWRTLEPAFDAELHRATEAGADLAPARGERPRRAAAPPRRLPASFRPPAAPAGVRTPLHIRMRPGEGEIRPHFEWAGAEAIAVGTVVHRELERLGRQGLPAASLHHRPGDWADSLRRLGLPEDRIAGAVRRVAAAADRIVGSETAARLLDPAYREAASELSLTAWLDGGFATVKVDRTFVDPEGVRWIVDWKTGVHEGADIEQFLDQEIGRYATQLERYARIMALHDSRPQCVGLYFPLLDRWKAWRP